MKIKNRLRCLLCTSSTAVDDADENNETAPMNTTERDGDTKRDSRPYEDTSRKHQGHEETAARRPSDETSHGDAGQKRKAVAEVYQQQKRDQQARERQAKEQQARDQQAREQQAREEQAREQQAREQQARDQQARDQQARNHQAKEQQAREQQARDQQAREQAREKQARQQQARDQQAKEQQARDQQARDQQARDQQARNQQAKEQQAREHQAREQQARDLQARNQQTSDQQARDQQTREQPTAGNSSATGFPNKHREMDIPKKKRETKQDSRPNEDTSGNHQDHEETGERETRLDKNFQRTAHVPASTTSAAQPLNEVNSASSTRRYGLENNAVYPHIQRMHVSTQNHQLSLASQHCAQQHSFKQESVPCQKAKLSYIHSGNTLSPIVSTFREDSSERQQEIATRAINCGPKPGMPTINKEQTENTFCLAKAADDVNKTNDKIPNYESLHDTSADTIQKRSMTNLSYPKPSVELSIDHNSGGQSYDADIVNKKETPSKRLNTVCDSEAAHSEFSIEGENKKILDDTLIATDDTGCTVEQLPDITSNLDTKEVHNQDKDGFAVTQTACETYETISIEMKEFGGKSRPDLLAENSYTTQAQADEDYVETVESIAKPNGNISKAGDENVDRLFDKEPSNWKDALSDETCDWKTADFGDIEVTIDQIVEDEQNSWKEVLTDEIYDWKNAEFGDVETTFDEIVEDNQNDWKKALIDDRRAAEFGETDKTNDKTFEDKHNRLEAATDDKMKLARTEMPTDYYNSSDIDCRAADAWPASIVENHLNEVNEPPDSRTESDQKDYSHSNLILARNDEKVEECFEELRKHLKDQPLSSFETNTSEESGVFTDKTVIDSRRPAEDVPIGTELDLNTAESDSPHGLKKDEDKQDGAVVEGHQSGPEGQDIASIQQNTETGPVNDQEEKQVPSSTASVAQRPHKDFSPPEVSPPEDSPPEDSSSEGSSPDDCPPPISIFKTKKMKARCPVGLQNLGNTCFFNAVMQGLNRLSLTESMVRFYDQMRMRSGPSSTVSPREVLSNICRRSPRFAGGRQQDSHELLRHLLDGIRNEERESSRNPNNRKILTKVDKVFGGHFMTVYTCKDCKTPYHVCEPMLDISLPIAYEDFENDESTGDGVIYQKAAESLMTPLAVEQKKDAQDSRSEYGPEKEVQQSSKKKNKTGKRKSKVPQSATKKSRTEGRSILDCLDAFTRTEHIADEYLCMTCHAERESHGATDYQMTSARKRTLIYNPPALLTLHLKRFEQTKRGFVKCNDKISFQDMIDIGPYCSSWCMRNEGKETSIWYSLYGVVVHGGSLDGGHYVAYVKIRETDDNIRQFLQKSYLDRDELTQEKLEDMIKEMHDLPKPNQTEKWRPKPVKGNWFYISDSYCSEVSEDQVWSAEAYLLFYERMQGKNQSNKSMCYQRTGTSV